MASAAEQDNRVKIPDGTAAVCADVALGENRSLEETPGRLSRSRESATAPISISQKTYGTGCSALCVLWRVRLSQKNGCGTHDLGAAIFIFQEE